MIDVKKFVTGFLVLALATGVSAALISSKAASFNANPSADNDASTTNSGETAIIGNGTNAQGVAIVADATNTAGDPFGGNAFLPQSPSAADILEASDTSDDSSSTDAMLNDPNNLTGVLASTYMTDLVDLNPNGVSADQSGNSVLTPPDPNSVIDQLISSSTLTTNLALPNWDAEANQIPIDTVATSSADAVTSYSTALQGIFNEDFVQPNLEGMLNNNSDPSAGLFVQPKIQTALQDIAGLQVPYTLASFQKSLVKVLVYEKNVVGLAEGITSSTDPLKSALVLQDETPAYDSAMSDFQSQLQKASALKGFSPLPIAMTPVYPAPAHGVTAFVDNLLGIKTSYALFGLGDITFDPTVFGQMLISYAKDIALQIVKNLIISMMQKTVLKWVQGSGVPKFIQNWGTTLVNAYTNAAVNALNNQFACVNPAFAPQLKILLKIPTPSVAGANSCAVQFPAVLAGSNLTKFYNNFQSGGFVSYMALFQPGGNVYGAAIDAQDAAAAAGSQNLLTVQTKSIANQGWVGNEICDNDRDPNTGCLPGDILNGSGMCQPKTGSPYTAQGGGGTCSDGSDPQTVQPGQVVGQVFNSAVDSGGNLTAAANDVAGLLDAFLSSLLNSIATDAITTTTGALQNLGSSSGGSGSGSSSNGGQSGQVPISCTATLQDQSSPGTVTFIGAGGQTISVVNGQVNNSSPTYSWSVLDGTPSSGNGGQFISTFNASGTYIATITDTNPSDADSSGNPPAAQCNITIQ